MPVHDKPARVAARNNKGRGLSRLLRYRLLIPILRSRHPPEYTARGVSVGLAVALTPTIGVQMPVVFMLWIGVRRLRPAWDFNLLVALAWIWLTNVVTMPLIYYLFLVTGRDLLGRWEKIRDLSTFNERFSGALDTGAGGLETLWVYTQRLVEQLGCPRCLAWLWSYASPHPASAPATRAATPGAGRVAAPGKRGDRRSHCLGDSPEMSPRQMTGILSAELRLRTGRRHLRCRWFSRRAGRQLPFTP